MKHAWIPVCAMLIAASLVRAAGPNVRTLPLGASAPDFNLPGVDGKYHALHDYDSARILMIVFTCNHCPTAQAYEDRIKQLVTDYRDKGVAVVAINPNDPKALRLDELGYTDLSDTFAEMKIRAQAHHFNFPYLRDGPDQKVARAYGPTATPHVFIFDRARKLRYVGHIDNSERPEYVTHRDARNALDALLAGRQVPVPHTKAFGCSIKWSEKEELVKQYMAHLAALPVKVELADAKALKELRSNHSDNLRLVNFWATWCGPCVAEFPELVKIDRMYGHRAFEFVSVSANYPDEKRAVLRFLKTQQASNRNLLFGGTDKYKLMNAFDPDWNDALPYTVLISPGGKILYRQVGSIDPLELRRAIVRSLKEDRF